MYVYILGDMNICILYVLNKQGIFTLNIICFSPSMYVYILRDMNIHILYVLHEQGYLFHYAFCLKNIHVLEHS